MIPPTSIDGTDITGATIDGQDVEEITVDGQTVFTAGVPGLIDNFEDGNFNEYTGQTSSYSIINSGNLEGSRFLKYVSSGNDDEIFSSSGLDNYPQLGDTFQFLFDTTSAGRGGFFFGDDQNNFFEVIQQTAFTNQTQFGFTINGSRTSLNDTWSLPSSPTRAEIQWTTSNIIVETFDLSNNNLLRTSTFSNPDSSITGGIIGFTGRDGDGFDDVRIL